MEIYCRLCARAMLVLLVMDIEKRGVLLGNNFCVVAGCSNSRSISSRTALIVLPQLLWYPDQVALTRTPFSFLYQTHIMPTLVPLAACGTLPNLPFFFC